MRYNTEEPVKLIAFLERCKIPYRRVPNKVGMRSVEVEINYSDDSGEPIQITSNPFNNY